MSGTTRDYCRLNDGCAAGRLEPDIYDKAITGCQVEVMTLERLLSTRNASLLQHLKSNNMELLAAVPQWFLSLYCQDFPMEVSSFQCFLFQNLIKSFLDSLIQKRCILDNKINNFRGDDTDVSAKKGPTGSFPAVKRMLWLYLILHLWSKT